MFRWKMAGFTFAVVNPNGEHCILKKHYEAAEKSKRFGLRWPGLPQLVSKA